MDVITQSKLLMHESCSRVYSIEHFCEQVGVPYHTLRKLFRRLEGTSLSAYWQRCRLQKAEELLSDPEKRIFEVAYEMEFSADGNFTNWFKKRKGMTPTVYKQIFSGGGGEFPERGQNL